MVATLNQQISKEYEVEQGRAQPWGAFVHLSGTSACLWLQHESTFGVLPCVGWDGVRWCWCGVPILWCFYSVCGFTFATWHCAVCALRQMAAGGCSSPRSSKQSPTIVRLRDACNDEQLCGWAKACVWSGEDVVLRAGWGHSCFWWGWGHSRAVSGDGGSALLACVPVCHTS